MAATSELVRSFYDDLLTRWDDTAVDSVLSPGFEFRGSLGTTTVGRDGSTAAARLLYSGTHTGPLRDVPPTGRGFEYAGAEFFTVEGGLLRRVVLATEGLAS